MRLRVGAALCLFLAFWGAGCRKALAPTTLANQAPETWIVAAPQDTITIRDQSGATRPQIGKIPVRFHMYWAGTDRDGTVVGYYFAVVETLPVPSEGASSVPNLPGPKARDYHYTTATDSIFIFHASEEVSERQHAFFIYAVDDKGRADPTPARFIFSSYDRFPPTAVIDECKATGFEYFLLPNGGVQQVQKTYFVTDFFEISNDHVVPRDTVMSNAQLSMRWHGVPTIPSTVVTGYKYKLDEPNFNAVDSSVHVASYNTGVGNDKVTPGPKVFTLRAIGQSGWRGENTRWFQMNFAPDTWFSGPDPTDPYWSSSQDGNGKNYLFKSFETFPNWGTSEEPTYTVPNSMLSLDSMLVLPAVRPSRKTFMEVYQDRLWLRQEDDTVHMNSWVIIPSGGFDRDSRYAVKVNLALDSVLAAKHYPVTTPTAEPNGSPIGFRIKVQVKDKSGLVSEPSETTTYPVIDPASVFHQPVINGYQGVVNAGRAYATIRAEDGDGTVDRRIDQRPLGAVGIVDRVEAGGAPAADVALRSKVLTFYVNHAPQLQRNLQSFFPKSGSTITRTATGPSAFFLPAQDDDPFDPGTFTKIGGPPANFSILRRKIAIRGKLTGTTRDTCYIVSGDFSSPNGITFDPIPSYIAAGPVVVQIRLCDCAQCDVNPGTSTCPFQGRELNPNQGTCVDTDIPCILAGPEPGQLGGSEGPPTPPAPRANAPRRQP
jgi:hypothetical protein